MKKKSLWEGFVRLLNMRLIVQLFTSIMFHVKHSATMFHVKQFQETTRKE